MAWWSVLISPLGEAVGMVRDHFVSKRRIKEAITENTIRLAQSEQTHNQTWELRQLENVGWKDDVLFYAFIAMFVWAGFDPVGSERFFTNLQVLPEWFIKTWFWVVASVLGVKKIGDYAPALIAGVKAALKGQ
jgi:hypothetical protein